MFCFQNIITLHNKVDGLKLKEFKSQNNKKLNFGTIIINKQI